MPRLRDPERGWLHLLALVYALSAYGLGLALMLTQSLPLALLGSLPLAHGLVIGAYLVHECTHNTIFADQRHNHLLGGILSWLAGGGYGDYRDIRRKHMRHHVDRADVIAYDYRALLERHPILRRSVEALEWAYIPAVDLLMHGLVLMLPFLLPTRRHRRGRVVVQLLIRGGLFAVLAVINPAILLAYPLGYLLFLHGIRFMDVHQHTYPVVLALDSREPKRGKKADRAFEQRNTYSNLCLTHPWINLLSLNFGYHNAHHLKPNLPWYDLPQLHREVFPEHDSHSLPLGALIGSYHRYRVQRVLHGDEPDALVDDGRTFVGVLGVSFVTAH
ncbi:MAG: fatty acid desaturase [Candidatus Thiodiazotropha sp.]